MATEGTRDRIQEGAVTDEEAVNLKAMFKEMGARPKARTEEELQIVRLCCVTKAWTTNKHRNLSTLSHHCFWMETMACHVQCWPWQWGLWFVEALSSQSHQRKASGKRCLWCDQVITAWEGWQHYSSLGDRRFHHWRTEKDGQHSQHVLGWLGSRTQGCFCISLQHCQDISWIVHSTS